MILISYQFFVIGADEAEEMAGTGLVDSICEHMENATHKK